MSNQQADWNVLPHGEVQELAKNLLWVQGSLPRMSLKRAMTVARMGDGRLVIHNGVALDESGMKRVEAFGDPAFLIVPNAMHRLDAPAYKARYPNIQVLAPKAAVKAVSNLVPVDGSVERFSGDGTVTFQKIDGVDNKEVAMVVNSPDGSTLVLADIVFNMDKKKDFLGNLFTTMFGSAPGPRVSRLARFLLVADRAAARRSLEQLAETPGLQRLIVAHEKVASGADAVATLRQAATYL